VTRPDRAEPPQLVGHPLCGDLGTNERAFKKIVSTLTNVPAELQPRTRG
jgi:hypothetical protein